MKNKTKGTLTVFVVLTLLLLSIFVQSFSPVLATANEELYVMTQPGGSVIVQCSAISGSPVTVGPNSEGSWSIPSGSSVTLAATNFATGFGFSGWSGSLSGSQNPDTFMITSEMSITAVFWGISLNPFSGTAQQDGSTSTTLDLTPGLSSTQSISVIFPSGTSSYLSDELNYPTLTLYATESAPFNTYSITLQVTNNLGQSVSTSYQLTVSGYTVSFVPSGLSGGVAWSISVDGTAYGPTVGTITISNLQYGSHSLTVPNVSGGTGIQYETGDSSGGFAVPGTSSLTIPFTTYYQLTISVSPSSDGTTSPPAGIYWFDSGYETGIIPYANSGFQFADWVGSGSGSYSGTGDASPAGTGIITMNGPITETAQFGPASLSVSISPSSWTMDVGQSEVFTAVASGGSGTYLSYQWYVGSTEVQSGSSSTYTYSASQAGNPSITVTVTDSSSNSAQSNAISIAVAAAPSVTIAPTGPLTLAAGQVEQFTATANGGTGTLSYQWLLDGSAVGSNSASYSYTASGNSHSLTCEVTDTASVPDTSPASNAVSITVSSSSSSPTASVSPSSWTMDVGQSETFTASASGGSGSYLTYQWYVDGSSQNGANSQTFSYSPSATGSHQITVTVTDSSGATSAQSSPALVSVADSPTVTVSPVGSLTLSTNQIQAFTATESGGSGVISYQWYIDGAAVGLNSASYSYTASGSSHSVTCKATDSASVPVTSTSNAVLITVNSALSVSVSPVSWTMDIGQSKVFTAAASGGSGSYSQYQWYVNGALQGSSTSSTFTYTPLSTGNPSITVTVTDTSSSTSSLSSPATVTVNASPTVSVTPIGPLTLTIGEVQVFTATSSGGSGSISYQWYLDGNAVGSNSASYSYSASGTAHSITCKITDSASASVTSPSSNAVSVTVNLALSVSISPSSWSMNVGQTETFTATANGGTGSYSSYQWYVSGAAQPGQTASTFSYAPISTGSPSITVTVTDSSDTISSQSSPVTVTVSAAQTSPTPSSSPTSVQITIASGQGGAVSYSYSGGSGTVSSGTSKVLSLTSVIVLHLTGAPSNPNQFVFGSWTLQGLVSASSSTSPTVNVNLNGNGQIQANFGFANLASSTITTTTAWDATSDSYSATNYGDTWNPGGSCYGFASTDILYYLHYGLGNSAYPYFPLQSPAAQQTSDLLLPNPSNGKYTTLNNAYLAIMVHQTYDPGSSSWAISWDLVNEAQQYTNLVNTLATGEPALLTLDGPNNSYGHAVVAFAVGTLTDGTDVIALSDNDYPQQVTYAFYDPATQSFSYNQPTGGYTFDKFTVLTPSMIQASWWWSNPFGIFQTWEENVAGYILVFASKQVTIQSPSASSALTSHTIAPNYYYDYFGSEGNSGSFVCGIANSWGFEEGNVQVYAVPSSTSFDIIDPTTNQSSLMILRVENDSGTIKDYAYSFNATSTGLLDCVISPSNGSLVVSSIRSLTATVELSSLIGGNLTVFQPSTISLSNSQTANCSVKDWQALNFTLPSVALSSLTNAKLNNLEYILVIIVVVDLSVAVIVLAIRHRKKLKT